MPERLALSRSQILSFRLRSSLLHERLPLSAQSLRRAAWAGLQDSSPRAALLSLHARVREVKADTWEHESLVQLWGPRYNDYVVAAQDLALFSLGRQPQDARGRERALSTASRLGEFLQGRRMPFGEAGHAMGVNPNSLRYAATTGTVLLRWDGSRQPVVWTVPSPSMDPLEARAALARRYLHVFGPSTEAAFAKWAGIGRGASAFNAITRELTPAEGNAWILSSDEAAFRASPKPIAGARFLPSGDAFYLLWGADREVLVPDAQHRAELWTTRVWPGALLLNGEIVGVWNRSAGKLSIRTWHKLTRAEQESVEAEASALPLPGLRDWTMGAS